MGEQEHTGIFRVGAPPLRDVRDVLQYVYSALEEKGYNPIDQIVGYLISGDPTYITSHGDARTVIRQVDRLQLMEELVRVYIEDKLHLSRR